LNHAAKEIFKKGYGSVSGLKYTFLRRDQVFPLPVVISMQFTDGASTLSPASSGLLAIILTYEFE